MIQYETVVRCTLAEWLEHGPAIMRGVNAPMRVVPTDRQSLDVSPDRRALWTVDATNWVRYADRLPPSVYEHLPGAPQHPRGHVYASEADANAALSEALLTWARMHR